MPTTGWSICAIRCGSARPWPPPRENHATFVEISPHPLLTYAISDTLASTSSADHFIVTSAMKRGEDETLFFHAQLATLGVTVPDADGGRLADIPPSPWLHSRYWVAKTVARAADCRMFTRCSGCTLKCHRAATMCGRQISEPR